MEKEERPRRCAGAFRFMRCEMPQVIAIGPPFDPVAPLIGAGEKM